jgi:hypothetical protein
LPWAGSLLVSNDKAAVRSQGSRVACAVQDAHNHKLALVMHVIDGVVARESSAQPWREMLAQGRRLGKMPKRLASILDLVDQPRRRRLGSFAGNIKPNLGKIEFCRVG